MGNGHYPVQARIYGEGKKGKFPPPRSFWIDGKKLFCSIYSVIYVRTYLKFYFEILFVLITLPCILVYWKKVENGEWHYVIGKKVT